MEKKIPSVIPVYLVGAFWFLYALIFPLYRLTDVVIALCLSIIAYIAGNKWIPGETIYLPEEIKIDKTGDAEIDRLLKQGEQYMKRLGELNETISDPMLGKQINQLREISRQVFDFISKYPSNTRQINKFMDYYYPTALKLIESYCEFNKQSVKGDNINDTLAKITNIMDSIVLTFERQLDNLYGDKALDIMTDIEVLKNIMAREGFTDDGVNIDISK